MLINVSEEEYVALRKALHEYRTNKNMLVLDFVELFIGEMFKSKKIDSTEWILENIDIVKENIIAELCTEFDVDRKSLLHSRKGNIPYIQHSLSLSLFKNTKLSQTKIGYFRNRDNKSVRNSLIKLEGLLKYPDVKEIYDKVNQIVLKHIKLNLNVRK